MICENCDKKCESKDVIISVKNGCEISFYCRECNKNFSHCPMCQHNTPCGFFNDPDPMPQFVMVARQMRQGNATFVEQKQIPNAERIKKFCLDGKCKCAIDDPEHPLCCRYGGFATCSNYIEKGEKNSVELFSKQELDKS